MLSTAVSSRLKNSGSERLTNLFKAVGKTGKRKERWVHTYQALKSLFVFIQPWCPPQPVTLDAASLQFPHCSCLWGCFSASLHEQGGPIVQHDSWAAAGNWYMRNLIKLNLAFCLACYYTWGNYNRALSAETDIKGPEKEYPWWELWLSPFYGWRNWGMDC